jgi:TPR repeat protein
MKKVSNIILFTAVIAFALGMPSISISKEFDFSMSPAILESGAEDHDASNYPKFVELKTQADAGDANAQFEIGYAYYSPSNDDKFNIARNYKLAHQYFEQSAKQGEPQAQYFMGHLYFYGEGVLPNLKQAGFWYRQSAQQGYQRASERLNELTWDDVNVSIEKTKKNGIPKNFLNKHLKKRIKPIVQKTNLKSVKCTKEAKVLKMMTERLLIGMQSSQARLCKSVVCIRKFVLRILLF